MEIMKIVNMDIHPLIEENYKHSISIVYHLIYSKLLEKPLQNGMLHDQNILKSRHLPNSASFHSKLTSSGNSLYMDSEVDSRNIGEKDGISCSKVRKVALTVSLTASHQSPI